jgi:hypothetical protein
MRHTLVKPICTCLCAATLLAQPPRFSVPRIGPIEYYGVHKLALPRISKTLNLKSGDPLPPSKGDLEDRLEKIPGVVQARLEAICCQPDGTAVLFVGIEEKGAPHFAFRSPPSAEVGLPPEVGAAYDKLLAAIEAAGRRGSTAEDLTQGHALMADPDARSLQQGFAAYSKDHLDLLRNVIRNASDPGQRAMSATIIGYAPDKTKVVNDLEYAMQDPDESVRANAMRAMGAIAVLASREPDLGIRISATWFVEMLNSIVLSDRFKAATALVNLTEKDGKAALDQIRERAEGSVLEMAQWKNLRYALPAYILLGRMAGVSEHTIEESWNRGQRDTVVMRFAAGAGRR